MTKDLTEIIKSAQNDFMSASSLAKEIYDNTSSFSPEQLMKITGINTQYEKFVKEMTNNGVGITDGEYLIITGNPATPESLNFLEAYADFLNKSTQYLNEITNKM